MPLETVAPALGVYTKLGIGAAAPATAQLDYQSETLGLDETFLDTAGLRGTRSRMAARTVPTFRRVAGDVVLTPNPVELATVLPYVLGGTPSGTSYPLGEQLPAFVVQILRAAGSLFTYTGCRVAQAVFRGQAGQALELTLSLLGIDETVANAAFPSLSLDTTTLPFVFNQLTLTVATYVVQAFSFELTVDNGLEVRQVNSPTATAVYATDRPVTLSVVVPFGDAANLYGLASAGVAAAANFTSGGTSLDFATPALQLPRRPVTVPNRSEVRLTLQGGARYAVNPGDELAVTLDSVP
jgi:hypothetical protein